MEQRNETKLCEFCGAPTDNASGVCDTCAKAYEQFQQEQYRQFQQEQYRQFKRDEAWREEMRKDAFGE